MSSTIEETRIEDYKGILDICEDRYFSCRYGEWIFRGQSSPLYTLKPSIGRVEHTERSFARFEKSIFSFFKRSAHNFIHDRIDNEYEYLAVAQHHGLPTRLLDWSYNPLVGLFFAVRSNPKEDGILYALHADKRIADEILLNNKPFEIEKTYKYVPRILASRLSAQEGVFTIHSSPHQSLEEELRSDWELERIRIPAALKEDLQYLLFRQGVHHAKLFPDLDGLAQHLTWQHMVMPVQKIED